MGPNELFHILKLLKINNLTMCAFFSTQFHLHSLHNLHTSEMGNIFGGGGKEGVTLD